MHCASVVVDRDSTGDTGGGNGAVGSLRKTSVWLGLAEDSEDELDPDVDLYDDGPVEHEDRRSGRRGSVDLRTARRTRAALAGDLGPGTVEPLHPEATDSNLEIATVHAHSFHDARTVGEYFRRDIPVIIDLSALDDPDARRIVDFSAGLIFGRRGDIHRLARGVFLLAPAGVAILTGGRSPATGGELFEHP
jgi:cell division inhibitor SepF